MGWEAQSVMGREAQSVMARDVQSVMARDAQSVVGPGAHWMMSRATPNERFRAVAFQGRQSTRS